MIILTHAISFTVHIWRLRQTLLVGFQLANSREDTHRRPTLRLSVRRLQQKVCAVDEFEIAHPDPRQAKVSLRSMYKLPVLMSQFQESACIHSTADHIWWHHCTRRGRRASSVTGNGWTFLVFQSVNCWLTSAPNSAPYLGRCCVLCYLSYYPHDSMKWTLFRSPLGVRGWGGVELLLLLSALCSTFFYNIINKSLYIFSIFFFIYLFDFFATHSSRY